MPPVVESPVTGSALATSPEPVASAGPARGSAARRADDLGARAGRVVLVTGASRGIGRVIATNLAQAGYTVFGTSRQAGAADPPPAVRMTTLDLRDDASVRRCVEHVLREAGGIDALVNNAGFDLYGALEETSLEEFHEQLDTNFMGVVRITKAVLPGMRERGRGGRIVNVGSIGGRIGLPMNSAYSASKFALEGFSESLRLELLPHHIHVSVVVPGAVATDTLDTSIREVAEGDGAYAARRRALVERMRADGARSAVRPADVARAVARLLADATPPLSRTVGAQATWVPRMKAALPQRTFERLMRRLFP